MAIRRGIREATGDAILFIDGDGQDPPDDLARLIVEMEKGADMVNGSKFIGTLKDGAISLPNYYGNRFMSGMINLLFGVRITDSQSGFRAFNLEKVRKINLDASEYEIETEMLIKAIRQGFKIVEVGVTRDKRASGETSFKRVRNGLRILGTIIKLRLTAA
jgi:glycosyltransferase involved in cell wall biosynthesis